MLLNDPNGNESPGTQMFSEPNVQCRALHDAPRDQTREKGEVCGEPRCEENP
jgi:hypothetical protein